jgi:miniconductance mechanosensitive channel
VIPLLISIASPGDTPGLLDAFRTWIEEFGMGEGLTDAVVIGTFVVSTAILCFVAHWITQRLIVGGTARIAKVSKASWDDVLVDRKVFSRLAQIAPAVVVYGAAWLVMSESSGLYPFVRSAVFVYLTVVFVLTADAFLNAVHEIYRTGNEGQKVPIKGFIQVLKIILYFAGGISVLSILLQKSPFVFLGGLGAMTAVLMLVFKDSILGLVAGVQMATNDMVRPGDWIEMPAYGADGDVLEVSLTTVKVQNWDKTISTIPTHAMVSNSFKNWRGMSESEGRRIKRSISLDMNTVGFCTDEMLERFEKISVLIEYLANKQAEIEEHNRALGVDPSMVVNGRRMTNLGTFRAYVLAYLRSHPMIHKEMTLLVRQLAPSETGIPIEIYVFSTDKAWANYEAIQADIFDHLLAVIPEFSLRVFQNPTGRDLASLASGRSEAL